MLWMTEFGVGNLCLGLYESKRSISASLGFGVWTDIRLGGWCIPQALVIF
jgi:hypothetical protein